jgi:hypothetical protein
MNFRMMLLFGRGHIRTEAELRKSFGAVGRNAGRVLSLRAIAKHNCRGTN